ncbi:CMRF35-like molecule 8 [Gymnodraco acuticeps]|uniref:CMRF35-like molecule 8 n=1 Tax=Gymnodraco acuticeps TaxID=8218 RepID=A0A6P8W8T0_GYMAC|nr:CMRF35-like molecule 8 [Gymnodraco acuticeps]
MAVHLSFLLILTGLTGSHGITTVSKVSVRAGGSITVPCLYESQYINHVKYLCKGSIWNFCSDAIKTNQHNTGKFSISDDKQRKIFTVTINDLTDKDTEYYWCAVEIKDGTDLKEYFHLSVTGGSPSLYVAQQEITGFKGDNINIKYHCQNSGERKWCRLGGSCVTRSGSIDGARVEISASNSGVLTVTLSGLRTESSGWYWCVKGDLQMPVHITVTEKPRTIAATSQITTLTPTSKPVNHTSSTAEQRLSTVEVEQQSVSVNLIVFIIPLGSLIFIVTVASFICLMFKRHKQTTGDSPATIMGKEEVTYSTVKQRRKTSGQLHRAEEEVTYSDVKQRKPTDKWTDANRDVDEMYSDVMYSSVVTID